MSPSASLPFRVMALLMKAAARLTLQASGALSPGQPTTSPPGFKSTPAAMHIHGEAAPSSKGLASWAFISRRPQLSAGHQMGPRHRRAAVSRPTVGFAEWKGTITHC